MVEEEVGEGGGAAATAGVVEEKERKLGGYRTVKFVLIPFTQVYGGQEDEEASH